MKAAVILALALVVASVCVPAARAASTYSGTNVYKGKCVDSVYTDGAAYGTKCADSVSYAGTDCLGAYGGSDTGAQDQPDCC